MKVMVNSIPKGGTHLLLKLVYLLGIPDDPKRFWLGAGVINRHIKLLNKILKGSYGPDRVTIGCEVPVEVGRSWLDKKIRNVPDNHSFGGHCIFSRGLSKALSDNNVKVLCVIRDPRSIVASHLHYVKKWKGHFFHKEYMALPSDKDRLLFSINGGAIGKFEVQPISERYLQFIGWMDDPNAHVVRFEDLVGKAGGGDDMRQFTAVQNVANFLEIDLNGDELEHVSSCLYGQKETATQSETFRKGKIDSWKDELDEELLDVLDEQLADLQYKLGYQ